MTAMTVLRPLFLNKLAQLYYGRLIRCFVLTGNIHDLFPLEEESENGRQINFLPLEEVLARTLQNVRYPKQDTPDKFIVITLKSDGIHMGSLGEEIGAVEGSNKKVKIESLKTIAQKGIPLIEIIKLLRQFLKEIAQVREVLSKENPKESIPPICIVIDQAETIFPNLPVGQMSANDRDAWRYFCDLLRDESIWPDAKTADQRPDFIILFSPTMAELNSKLFSLPKVESVEIAPPDKELIKLFIAQKTSKTPIPNLYGGKTNAAEALAKDATGLSLRVLDDLITAAQRDPAGSSLNRQTITAEINKRYGLELKETINIIRPSHAIDDLIGRRLIARLKFFADEIIDDSEKSPAGVVFVGPNGTGKTYVAEAFGVYTERAFISLGAGIRSKWYGEQGIFLEGIERVVANYEKTIIFVDEADAKFGIMHKSETYEAEKQFSSKIVEMIGNPKYRGKILWILATTRPDLLEPDFVRPGRCSLFIPICDPEEEEDRQAFLKRMLARIGKAGISLTDEEKEVLQGKSVKENEEFATVDYGKFVEDLIFEKSYREKVLKENFDFRNFCAQWRPAALRIGRERKFQLLQAALLADWRELLPKSYREKSDTEIRQEIEELRFSEAWNK